MNQKRNNDELLTTVFGSKEVLEPAPTDVIPQGMMRPEIAYQIVKDDLSSTYKCNFLGADNKQ